MPTQGEERKRIIDYLGFMSCLSAEEQAWVDATALNLVTQVKRRNPHCHFSEANARELVLKILVYFGPGRRPSCT